MYNSRTSIIWPQGVVYPIRLSGICSYPAWLRNKGVRIIKVLQYILTQEAVEVGISDIEQGSELLESLSHSSLAQLKVVALRLQEITIIQEIILIVYWLNSKWWP